MSNIVYTIKDSTDPRGIDWIPDAMLRRELGIRGNSGPPGISEFFEVEGGEENLQSFVAFVPGGAALGVRYVDTIIVAFRGTTSNDDWGINLYGAGLGVPAVVRYTLDITSDDKTLLHAGFRSIAKALSLAIAKPLDDFIRSINDPKKVLFCGHSLGGALALLAGQPEQRSDFYSDLPWSQRVDAIYTFGAPKVGDVQAARLLPNVHFRYVLTGDPVPDLPPFGGFAHEMPCIRLNPYDYSPNPGFFGKLKKGWNDAKGLIDRSKKASIEVLSAEHDIGLYVKTIDAVLQQQRLQP